MVPVLIIAAIVALSILQFSISRSENARVRAFAPWILAVALAYGTAAFLPFAENKLSYGWPALAPAYLFKMGTVWCLPAFEAILVGRWFLRRPRGFAKFTLLCSAGTFAAWLGTLAVLTEVLPGS